MGFGPRFFLRSAPRPERSSPGAPARADDIRDLVAPVVGALGCSVYDVEVAGSGKARTVRVLIDREGGVDIDAIAEATRAISPLLDEADPVAGAYLLEVSSPGVERPLRTPAHFAAAVGETISTTFHTESGPRRVRGVCVSADADGFVVDADGTTEAIRYAAVTKARTVFEWGTPTPSTSDKRKKSGARANEKTS